MNLKYMYEALNIAKNYGNDIPVGAVIVKDGEIISKAVNEREKKQDATLHAEISAIKKANKKFKSWRLNNCEMYVTLEPCPMCASAIIQARVSKVYFGAYDFLNGAFGSKSDMKKIMNSDIIYQGGILEEECTQLLKNYFEGLRNAKNTAGQICN